MNYLWLGKSLPDAIAAPVLYVDGRTVIKGEPGFDEVRDDRTYKQAAKGGASPLLRRLSFLWPPGGAAGSGRNGSPA